MAEPDLVSDRDDAQFELLLRTWRELDVPDGWRAEIIDGDIRLMAPPAALHNFILNLLLQFLPKHLPDACGIYTTQGILLPSSSQLYIPDALILPNRALFEAIRKKSFPPASKALLTAEVVSPSSREQDRKHKLRGYALSGVPLYLLVDHWAPEGPSVTLFEEPEDGVYRRRVTVPFGESLHLPEPFNAEFDTSQFTEPDEDDR
ncbi:Uma2 family endonuclease [Nocardiopsis sp. CNT-189]|uniref:Uma2 family endonuclease n=1 Tax=Nocardiopsis oceanisediminis TaxID=2816862 RepID=UPI003B2B1ABC